jgi:hypothetical protein
MAEKIPRKNEKKTENAMKAGIVKGREGSKRMNGAVVSGRKAKWLLNSCLHVAIQNYLKRQIRISFFGQLTEGSFISAISLSTESLSLHCIVLIC